MIHGSTASIGCLAIGNPAAEELFVLAAKTGLDQVSILLSPVDFRVRSWPANVPVRPAWASEVYADLREALQEFTAGR